MLERGEKGYFYMVISYFRPEMFLQKKKLQRERIGYFMVFFYSLTRYTRYSSGNDDFIGKSYSE
jgi:hypothetical protein